MKQTLRQNCRKWSLLMSLGLMASGGDFMQMYRAMRKEFVTSLRKLLADGAANTDERLISLVQRHIFPPSKGPYKMSYSFGPPPQAQVAMNYFKTKGQHRGFFVECGGLDGERSSNTYHLEAAGWEGLLIEADPDYFFQSLGKNRRSWKINAALCPSAKPSIVNFQENPNSGRGKLMSNGKEAVPCIPLSVLMQALNRTKIDFFSLDVEGLEMKILRSLPYKSIDINAITMEYNHNPEKPKDIIVYMSSVGYNLYKRIDRTNPRISLYTRDLFFIKREKIDSSW